MRGLMLLAGLALATPALAQQKTVPSAGVFKSGRSLHAACTSTAKAQLDICDWYLMGAYDAYIFAQDALGVSKEICGQTGQGAEALRRDWLTYVQKDATRLNYSAVSTIYNAIVEAHPCK